MRLTVVGGFPANLLSSFISQIRLLRRWHVPITTLAERAPLIELGNVQFMGEVLVHLW